MAERPAFVHLHLHTEYSLLDSLCRLDEVMARARLLGMSAVAMTDNGVLYGAWEFQRRARAAGLRPVLGCEIELAAQTPGRPGPGLVLLAENDEGWGNLVHLVSTAHLSRPGGRIAVAPDRLAGRQRGLIALSGGGNGEVNLACAAGDLEGARRAAGRYADLFGRESFFLELQNQKLTGQVETNAALRELGRKTGLACVATNNVHYMLPPDAEAHEVLRCVAAGARLQDPGRARYLSRLFDFCDGEEMLRRLPDCSDAIERTAEIAARCLVQFPEAPVLRFPAFPIPAEEGARPARGRDFAHLRRLARAGLAWRNGVDPDRPADDAERAAVERLEAELEIIRRTGFVSYFLLMQDVARFARDRGIPVGPGHGPTASSLVAYALGISGVDPLRYGLRFERLLNAERPGVPELDLGLPAGRRAEAIAYLRDRYGADRVAQIATFEKLGARMALRDTGRAIGLPAATCDRIAHLVPEAPEMTIERALRERPELRQCLADEAGQRLRKLAERIEGLPRHTSTHASGVVVGDAPLDGLLPLGRDREGATVTQYDMHGVAGAGLVKLDFLSLRPLVALDAAAQWVRRRTGTAPSVEGIALHDEATLRLLAAGDTVGVYLLDTARAREMLRRVGVARFEDLVVLLALRRPASARLFEEYAARRNGKAEIGRIHRLLAPVVHETYGLVLFQEQFLEATATVAGFTPGQAEALLEALAQGDERTIVLSRARFIEGAVRRHRIKRSTAEGLFRRLERIPAPGLNKAGCVAHAQVSFRTAWMKAHHPVEYLAACLSADPDRRVALMDDAGQRGIAIGPPDVNASAAEFVPEGQGLRFGLAAIKHVGDEAAARWVAERAQSGPFKDLFDFCRRAGAHGLNRRAVESLVRCGAFDATGAARPRLLGQLDAALADAAERRRDHDAGQMGLFEDDALGQGADTPAAPAPAEWSVEQAVRDEQELLGAPLSALARASLPGAAGPVPPPTDRATAGAAVSDDLR